MSFGEIAFLSCYLTDLAITVLFIVGFVHRIYLMSKMASHKNQTYRISFWIRVSVLLIYEGVNVVELLLSQTDPQFWLYQYSHLALILLISIFTLLVQIYLLVLEHKKKEKSVIWHKIYWAYEMIVTTILLVFVVLVEPTSPFLVIPVIKIILMLGLLVYSLFFQNDHYDTDAPLMSYPSCISDRPNESVDMELTPIEKPLFIQFNSIPNIHFKETIKYEFSIAVYGEAGTAPVIINRFESDFVKLQKDMERALNHSEDVSFPEVVRKGVLSHIGEGELKVKTYQEFLLKITRSSDFFVQPLLDFLGIAGQRKLRLLEMNKRRTYQGSISLNEMEPSIPTLDRKFFTVQFRDRMVRLQSSHTIIEQTKSAKEIEELHSRLIREGKVKKDMLEERENRNYQEFLEYCANSPKRWVEFSNWLGVARKVQIKVHRILDMWYNGLDFASVEVQGYELVANNEGQTYTVYSFEFKRHRDSSKKVLIKKRFSDFTRLNEQILIYYRDKRHSGLKLPSLPPKIAAFGSKTSPKSREKSLQAYLKRLLLLQAINHCISFLEFLQQEEPENVKTIYDPNGQHAIENRVSDDNGLQPSIDIDSLGVSTMR